MNRKFKRLTALALSITLSSSILPMSALAVQEIAVEDSRQITTVNTDIVDSGTCGENLTWTLNKEGTLAISGTGAMEDWDYDNRAPWDSNKYSIEKVDISSGVTSIGDYAFYYCLGLKSITIPDGVTRIGSWTFSDCGSLTSITIPDSVNSIGRAAFYDCGLTSIKLPNSLTDIESSTFADCDYLTSITIPNSVTSIGASAFSYCSGLTSITIPDNVTSIGDTAFFYCDSLTSVKLSRVLTNIADNVFANCSSLESITIPNGVTNIADCAFYNCRGLVSITIPKSVTSIGWAAFDGCSRLKDVYYFGAESDGKKINIGPDNGDLQNATIHYNVVCKHITELRNEKAATCTEKGYTGDEVCTVCGETVVRGKVVEALGHKTKIENEKAATCTEAGYTGDEVCTVCGETIKKGEAIAKKKHTYVIDPAVKATYDNTGLTEGKHCSVCGKISVKQEVIPKLEVNRVSSSKMTLTNITGRKLKVRWSRVSSVSGYRIEYSTSSKFTNYKKITISSSKTTSKTISNLTKGKRYYVRMRAYKKYSGKNYYSKWTSNKYMTIKK